MIMVNVDGKHYLYRKRRITLCILRILLCFADLSSTHSDHRRAGVNRHTGWFIGHSLGEGLLFVLEYYHLKSEY